MTLWMTLWLTLWLTLVLKTAKRREVFRRG